MLRRNVIILAGLLGILVSLMSLVPNLAESQEPVREPRTQKFDALLSGLLNENASSNGITTNSVSPENDYDVIFMTQDIPQLPSRIITDSEGRAFVDTLIKTSGSLQGVEESGAKIQGFVGDIAAARIPLDSLHAIALLPNVEFIQKARKYEPFNDISVPMVGASDVHAGGIDGSGVIIGIIDSGVDFTHTDFRHADGTTRIRFICDQTDSPGFDDATCPGNGSDSGGTLWSDTQINAHLAGIDFVRQLDSDGHGTHVLGTVAGDDPVCGGVAPGADLIVVKSELFEGDIISALDFIDEKAGALGMPYVVNMSFGSQIGPHDGTDLLSEAVNNMVGTGKPGKAIVVAAGNEGGDNIHAKADISQLSEAVSVEIPPLFVEVIDIWYEGSENFSFGITLPNGEALCCVAPGASLPPVPNTCQPFGNNTCIRIEHTLPQTINDDVEILVFIVAIDLLILGIPIDSVDLIGTWALDFAGGVVSDGTVNAWCAFSCEFNTPHGDDFMTVSEPGVAENAITVGAFTSRNTWQSINGLQSFDEPLPVLGEIAEFSSRGPTRNGLIKPDITAPGQGIVSTLSSSASFICLDKAFSDVTAPDGEHAICTGTSMATPHVTGAAALLLSQDPTLDAAQLKGLLKSAATRDGFTGADCNNVWGCGKLNVLNATTITVAPVVPNTLPAGNQFDVIIEASNVGGVAASDVTLEYNESLLTFVGARIGPSFTNPSDCPIPPVVNNSLGGAVRLLFACIGQERAGTGALWTLTFAAADVTQDTPLTFTVRDSDDMDLLLVNMQAEEITAVGAPSVSSTLMEPAELRIAKVDEFAPAVAGGQLAYEITVVNLGPADAENVIITDNLPPEASFASGTFANPVIEEVTEDLGLADGETTIFSISPANLPMQDRNGDEVVNLDDVTVMVDGLPAIVLSVDASTGQVTLVSPPLLGSEVTISYATLADTPQTGGCSELDGVVTCNLGTVAKGSTATATIVVDVASSVQDGVVMTNTASLSSDTPDPDGEFNSASVDTTVNRVVDLEIEKSVDATDIAAGEELTYTLTLTNAGPSDTSGIIIQDFLPAEVEIISASSDAGTVFFDPNLPRPHLVEWRLDELLDGSVVVLEIVGKVDSATSPDTTLQNTAGIVFFNEESSDPTPENTAESPVTTVFTAADLRVSKVASPDPAIAGDRLTYTITVTNDGPSDAQNITVLDNLAFLPDGTVFDMELSDGKFEPGRIWKESLSSLAADSSEVFKIVMVLPSSAANDISIGNIASVGAETEDLVAVNNTRTISTRVTRIADLEITKVDNIDPVTAGETVRYTITVTNNGPSDASGVTVMDTVPSGVTLKSVEDGNSEIGDLQAGESVVLEVEVEIDSGTEGVIANSPKVGGNEADPDLANNKVRELTHVVVPLKTNSGDADPNPEGVPLVLTVGNILDEGDTLEAKLTAPAGAVEQPTPVEIQAISSLDPALPPLPDHDVAFSQVYRLTPAGQTFNVPVLLEITYTDSELLGLEEASLTPVLLDSVSGQWNAVADCLDEIPDPLVNPCVSNRDPASNSLTVVSSHFSVFGMQAGNIKVVTITSEDEVAAGDNYFVVVASDEQAPNGFGFVNIADVPPVLVKMHNLDRVGLQAATHVQLVKVADNELPGIQSVSVDFDGDTHTTTLNVVDERENRNFYLFPGLNFSGLGLDPAPSEIDNVLGQLVFNASPDFVNAIGRTPTLSDIVERVYAFAELQDTEGNPRAAYVVNNTEHPCQGSAAMCQNSTGGPTPPDSLTDFAPFQGTIIKTREQVISSADGVSSISVFDFAVEQGVNLAVPVKMTVEGSFEDGLSPQFRDGWNLFAPHIRGKELFEDVFGGVPATFVFTQERFIEAYQGDAGDGERIEAEIHDGQIVAGAGDEIDPRLTYWVFVEPVEEP